MKTYEFNWKLDNNQKLQDLQQELETVYRKAFFANFEDRKTLGREVLDSFICYCLNFEKANNPWHWSKIDSTDVIDYATFLIHTELAYEIERIETQEARDLALQFLKQFQCSAEDILYFSNYKWDSAKKKPFDSGFDVSGATFNILLLGLTPSRVGFLLAEDED